MRPILIATLPSGRSALQTTLTSDRPVDSRMWDVAESQARECPDRFWVSHDADEAIDRFLHNVYAPLIQQGERVLIVAANEACANRLVELCGPIAILAMSSDELSERTSQSIVATATIRLRTEIQSRHRSATERLARFVAAEPMWERIAQLTESHAAADADCQRLTAECTAIPDVVRAVAAQCDSPLGIACRDADAATADATAHRAKVESELHVLREEWKPIAAQQEAKKAGRVLTGSFWKAMFSGDTTAHTAELEAKIHAAEQALRDIDAEIVKRASEPKPAGCAPIEAEIARRLSAYDAQLSVANERRNAIEAERKHVASAMAEQGFPGTRETFTIERAEVHSALAHAEREATNIDAETQAAVRRELLGYRVVVGTINATDFTDDLAIVAGGFTRLAICGAETLNETDYARLSGFAAKQLLLGDFIPRLPVDHQTMHGTHTNGYTKSHTNGKPVAQATDFAMDHWQSAYQPSWFHEADRLVVRLATPPLTKSSLICEPLIDKPEVELRFGTTMNGEYLPVEIAFPTSFPPAEAKALAARELGETRLTPNGTWHWHENGRLIACWPMPEKATGPWVELEAGVREWVIASDGLPTTAAVSFDPAAGWNRDKAEAYLERNTAQLRTIRAIVLPTMTAPAARNPEPAIIAG